MSYVTLHFRSEPSCGLRGETTNSTFARMTYDPHAVLRDAVLESVLRGTGQSDPETRMAAAADAGLPADLRPLVGKIHRNAYKVTDEDVAGAQAVYGDDALFEIIVSAALGASDQRLRAGLEALEALDRA